MMGRPPLDAEHTQPDDQIPYRQMGEEQRTATT